MRNKTRTAKANRKKVGPRPARRLNREQEHTRSRLGSDQETSRARSHVGQEEEPGARGQIAPRKFASLKRSREHYPVVLECAPTDDYALIDSGDGQKLERYGPYRVVRPEAQAIWQKTLDKKLWENVDAIFTGDIDEEGTGRWQFPKGPLGETWPLQFDGIDFFGRFTSFRHVGVFPEQASHWHDMQTRIKAWRGNQPRVLNLFGYTGLASLVAANAGAHVTHVDASKKAINWAKENQELARLTNKPIRWICEDATRFCEREMRRGNTYEIILLDPPQFGRGPKGEVWQMFEHLPHMLDLVRELTAEKPICVCLTAYAIRASFLAMHEIMQEVFGDLGGELQSGELVIVTEGSARKLSTSLYSRWVADHG